MVTRWRPGGTTTPWYARFVAIGWTRAPSMRTSQYLCPVTLMTRKPRPKLSTSSDALFGGSRTPRRPHGRDVAAGALQLVLEVAVDGAVPRIRHGHERLVPVGAARALDIPHR